MRPDRRQFPTKLSPTELAMIQSKVMAFLAANPSVSNRSLRKLTGIGYDQAIHFFGEMLSRGILKRLGNGAATKYVRG